MKLKEIHLSALEGARFLREHVTLWFIDPRTQLIDELRQILPPEEIEKIRLEIQDCHGVTLVTHDGELPSGTPRVRG